MRLHYHPQSESLTVDFLSGVGASAREVAPGIVASFDREGRVIGLEIALQNGAVDPAGLETIALLSADL